VNVVTAGTAQVARAVADWRVVQTRAVRVAHRRAEVLDSVGDTESAAAARAYAAAIDAEGGALLTLARATDRKQVAPAAEALQVALAARDDAAHRLGLSWVPTEVIRAGAELLAVTPLIQTGVTR
jgi:hypothetical protein